MSAFSTPATPLSEVEKISAYIVGTRNQLQLLPQLEIWGAIDSVHLPRIMSLDNPLPCGDGNNYIVFAVFSTSTSLSHTSGRFTLSSSDSPNGIELHPFQETTPKPFRVWLAAAVKGRAGIRSALHDRESEFLEVEAATRLIKACLVNAQSLVRKFNYEKSEDEKRCTNLTQGTQEMHDAASKTESLLERLTNAEAELPQIFKLHRTEKSPSVTRLGGILREVRSWLDEAAVWDDLLHTNSDDAVA